MSDQTRAQLRASLTSRYIQLRDRLTSRLGSRDLAGEALHEMWLRLQDGPELAPVEDPDAYLYRAALNTASNLDAARRRVLGAVDIDDLLNIPDDAPDPERIVIARNELAVLRRLLGKLTRRQRDIFIESFGAGATHAELAARYGVTLRLIQMELRHAILHCASGVERNNLFARGALRVSRK